MKDKRFTEEEANELAQHIREMFWEQVCVHHFMPDNPEYSHYMVSIMSADKNNCICVISTAEQFANFSAMLDAYATKIQKQIAERAVRMHAGTVVLGEEIDDDSNH